MIEAAIGGLPKRRLVEAAQFARVERLAFLLEHAERFDADPQMLADRSFVKGIGLAGQLHLAVQGLVGNAQEGAVGHTEAIALRSDRCRLHVDRHRAGLIEAERRAGVAQLPVAIVGGDHGAGGQPPLEQLRRLVGD